MSVSHEDAASDPVAIAEKDLQARYDLFETLEGFARAYSPDYEDGLEDGCRAGKGVNELGGRIEVDTAFEAKRVRTLIPSEEFSGTEEVVAHEYTVSTLVKKDNVLLQTIPKFLLDLAVEVNDYEYEDFRETREYGIGFTQVFTLKSEGLEFEREYRLEFYIDDDTVELSDGDLAGLLDETMMADTVSRPAADDAQSLFESIFDADEVAAMEESAQEALQDHDARVALLQFVRNLPEIRIASRAMQYEMAGRVVVQMFTEAPDGDCPDLLD